MSLAELTGQLLKSLLLIATYTRYIFQIPSSSFQFNSSLQFQKGTTPLLSTIKSNFNPSTNLIKFHHSRKGREPKNWLEINMRHVARWEHRLELLAQGAPIEAVGAPTSVDYMPWFLSITRRWMTP